MKKICYIVTVPITVRAFFIPQLKYLAENGFDVTIICSNDENLQTELGQNVHYLPVEIPRGISIKGSIVTLKKLIEIFKKEKFDLVQYSTPNAALYASVASKIVGIRVRNYHLMGYRYLGANGIGREILKKLEKITCRLSTNVECVSKSNLELGITEKIFNKGKATVVWNGSTGGVDIRRFAYSKRLEWREDVRRELGYKKNDFVFGFVGRVTKDKGINDLLKAYKMVNIDDKLLFVGPMEGEETLDKELLAYARTNKNIRFHSQVNDIERYYAALDVLILPSYREGFGNVIIEAGAVGTPAIVSDIPGPIDTIVKDKTAFIFEVKNIDELAEKMLKMRACDYLEMGENAAKFAIEKFDSVLLNEKILLRKRNLLKD